MEMLLIEMQMLLFFSYFHLFLLINQLLYQHFDKVEKNDIM